jgi:ligand-binding sensor protein
MELSDVVDPIYLQAIHETLSEEWRRRGRVHLSVGILDVEANPITFEQRSHCPFCWAVRESEAGVKLCRQSDKKLIESVNEAFGIAPSLHVKFRVCEMGLIDGCAPIIGVENEEKIILAYLFFGQMRCPQSNRGLKTPSDPTLDKLLENLPDKWTDEQKEHYGSRLKNAFHNLGELSERRFNVITKTIRKMADLINSAVQKVQESKRVSDNAAFMEKAVAAGSLDKLLDLTVTDVPGLIQAEYCSVFTVRRGQRKGDEQTKDNDRLVLRKTSYPGLKSEENRASYAMGEGLTGWVWANKKSLRVKNVRDAAEIQAHYLGAKWSGNDTRKPKYPDSAEHHGFLCVPMFGPTGDVTGVIRMPHKINPRKTFTKQDETFVMFLARHLAWVIECQELKDKCEQMLALINAVRHLPTARSDKEIAELAINHAQQLFRCGEGEKRHYIFCACDARSENWWISMHIGNMTMAQENLDHRYRWDEGLVGWVLKNGPQLVVDLAAAQSKGRYAGVVDNAESAMAAPLVHKGKIFGAIAVVSGEKFAFSPDRDLAALKNLADACAEQMARLKKSWWKGVMTWLKVNIPWLAPLADFCSSVFRKIFGI